MKRFAGMALCLLLALPCAAYGASQGGSKKGGGVSVTPLDDEFAGQSAPLYTPPGPVGQRNGQSGNAAGAGASNASGNPSGIAPGNVSGNVSGNGTGGAAAPSGAANTNVGVSSAGTGMPASSGDTKDSLVIAYLVDLARKQNRPCPSGATPPTPPSLVFSEPLCKAAHATTSGAEPLAAMAEQGVHAAKWRMFRAENAPAQRVVNGLRQNHCEALLEPYTHIGAYRDAGGWRILLVSLGEKPAEGAAPETGQAPPPQTSAAVPAPAVSSSAAPLAGETAAAAMLGGFQSKEPAANAGMSGQEARSLFSLLNELRAKGGACFGKELPPAPALAFNSELQTAAEKDARAPGSISGAALSSNGGMLYKGSNVAKLTLKANNHASVALDVWMVSPSQCETLFSPVFTEAGAAYEDGYWVLMLGGQNQGVPSDK